VAAGFSLDAESSVQLPSLSEFRSLATRHWLRVRRHSDAKDACTWSRLKRIVDHSLSGVQQLARTAAWWA
jgi:hypothetical protein